MRINWKAIWILCWGSFLVADQLFRLRPRLTRWFSDSESKTPDVFYQRVEIGLLALVVVIAVAPFVLPPLKRWILPTSASPEGTQWRDARDVSVWEALTYVAEASAWSRSRAEEDGLTRLKAAAAAFEAAVAKGEIVLRGKRPRSEAYEIIDADYWRSAGIDLGATIDPLGSGGKSETRVRARAQKGLVYTSLVADRAAVEKRWPPDNTMRRIGRGTRRGLAWSVGLRRRTKRAVGEAKRTTQD
jgi:hypothetical protein